MAETDILISAPYFALGASRLIPTANCGPAAVAAAICDSGVAFPTVDDVRITIGTTGPTNLDQWGWLLDAYGASWYSVWTQQEFESALRTGHVVVIAAWMSDVTPGPEFEQARSPKWGQPGRYCNYRAGLALLVVGTANGSLDSVDHDPNVFPSDETHWYEDGSPKGAFRRYPAADVWNTAATYGNGYGLAIARPPFTTPPPLPVKRVRPDQGEEFPGPGGGHPPRTLATWVRSSRTKPTRGVDRVNGRSLPGRHRVSILGLLIE